jgi:hypothetical protein
VRVWDPEYRRSFECCSSVGGRSPAMFASGYVRLLGNAIGAEGRAAIVASLRKHPGALKDLDIMTLSKSDPALPLELKDARNAAVLNYYRDLLSASVVSRRCRVMLLGTGGVGKTTLAHRLVTGSPAARTADVTHGVLQRRAACHPCSRKPADLFGHSSLHLLSTAREFVAVSFRLLQTTGASTTPLRSVFLPMVPWR